MLVAERTIAVALAAASASASELLWFPSMAASRATNVGGPASEPMLTRLGEEERFSEEPRSVTVRPGSDVATPTSCAASLCCSVSAGSSG